MGEIKDRKICVQNERNEWKALNARSGGASAPRDVLSANLKLYNAFRCLDHYVGVEKLKEEEGFHYVLNWRGGAAHIPSTSLGPYDPQRPHALRENMFILETSRPSANVKSFIIVPVEGFDRYWNTPGELEEYYLLPHFVSMTGRQLICDYFTFPIDAKNPRATAFHLDLVVAKDDFLCGYDDLEIPKDQIVFRPVLAEGPGEISNALQVFFEADWPGDRFFVRGEGDGVSGRVTAGIGFREPEVALDVGLEERLSPHGGGTFDAGALSAGVHYAERPFLKSRASVGVDVDFKPSFRLNHSSFLLPPLTNVGLRGAAASIFPFVALSHDLGTGEMRFVGGVELMMGDVGRLLGREDSRWSTIKATALLWDEALLALTAGQLAWEGKKAEAGSLMVDVSLGGLGFFAGEILFLDSMLIDGYRKGELAGAWPWAVITAKGIAAAATADPLPHLASTLFVGGATDLLQIFGGIDPGHPAWVLGHTVLGSGLWLAERNNLSGSEALGNHLRASGAMLLTYGLQLWIHANSWDRF